MESAIDQVTKWIAGKWSDLSQKILRDRRHVVNAYLAFLAIRQREFSGALRFLAFALMARPGRLFAPSFSRLFFMLLAHAIGIRVYRWDFWNKPNFYVSSDVSACQH